MRVLLCTDSFPPGCGGSGWSTFELARGLVALGHDVRVVQPRPGRGAYVGERDVDGLRVVEFGSAAPDLPFVRNYFKNERLRARLASWLTTYVIREQVDVVHGQHVLTGLPSIDAAAAAGVPSVCTVRDYWPVCYWSDLIHDPSAEHLCPACSPSAMTRCIRPRAGALWPLALSLVPYMTGNLRRKREGLAACDAVVAVSTAIAADLRARAPELTGTRLETIPNPVDLGRLRAVAARAARPLDGPYGLFVGKLAVNKGVAHLVPALASAGIGWPVVVVGDGPERARVEADARGAGLDVRFTGWLARDDALAWMAHASLLVFPSHGPESLSRVLLEAGALGVPAAAMDTGGTRDVVLDEITGLVSTSRHELAADLQRLARDEPLRRRLGDAARHHVERTFEAGAVVARIAALYGELRQAPRGGAA